MDTTPDHDPHAGDDRLGMNEPITRRDFVNAALVAGGGLWLHGRLPTGAAAGDEWTGYGGVGDYARSNGNTFDVMNAAHAIRDRTFESKLAGAIDTGETYDLLVVGGGISGLASAVFFQKRKGGRALVLDNHPIFGGEAKRNEFLVDGQSVVAHQGSAMFPVPKKGGYVASVYEMNVMDRPALEYQRWRGPSPEMPLSQTPYDTHV
jgi:spermidine dehydrogenase